jgi:Tc toxin complex TcA C-terminal TcB-binding domain
MVGQVSAVFFQCYQMAYDLAKRTEACYRFELGVSQSSYIQFGYWDSLKQGLLSGEKLFQDLKRLEIAYLDQNLREYEISKSISLLLLDPSAFVCLKLTGQCTITLPEALFDMDYPGHYMRRVRNVSLTIPCVTGPYTSVNCTLTLLQSKIRLTNRKPSPYAEKPVGSDDRFSYNCSVTESIATSTAQNDSGLFEVNFRDERYLPFEGAGLISQWQLSMPPVRSSVCLNRPRAGRERVGGMSTLNQEKPDQSGVQRRSECRPISSACRVLIGPWQCAAKLSELSLCAPTQ